MDTNATNDIAENYAGNPPVIEKPIGVIAEGIHQRILIEQQKLHTEEKNEQELTTKRIALLTEGSDKDVDACELSIDQSRSAQLRSLERIELLAEQLKQANRTAETQRLNELATTAERARTGGSKILNTVYPKLARQLAQALAELKEHQQTIVDANRELDAAKRDTIELADPQRHPITAPNGFVLGVVALHEVVNLPNEAVDSPAYWEQRNVANEFALFTLASPDMRNSRLVTP